MDKGNKPRDKLSLDTATRGHRLELAAIGMEAEFALVVNGKQVRPEDIFADPRAFVRDNLVHRVGRSYHLPTGAAVYFDTGVIEVATPVIEIERGCAARAGRSLWEAILYVRTELDHWERKTGNQARLVGFSAHYNTSFELDRFQKRDRRSLEKLALFLVFILPFPVMLLAANRRSTGTGVRPRGDRIEVTVDFTPSSSLMIAAATLITGIVREVMTWPSFEISMLGRRNVPVIDGFRPMPHTSRHGWLARFDCYPQNPFACGATEPIWPTRMGLCSLRDIAERIFKHFWRPIARISDPFTFRLMSSVIRGKMPSLLDLPDRPPEYEDVGRLCTWDNLFPKRLLTRSLYERVLMRAISGRKLSMYDGQYTPTGMCGWSQVVFRRDRDGTRHIFSMDYLLRHLENWERS
ncbi:MAG TPA: hypothetical protein VGL91_14105 [Acidobacteriota bacterium]